MGMVSPSLRSHTPSTSTFCVGCPAVATSSMMDLPKITGEMKTMNMRSRTYDQERACRYEAMVVEWFAQRVYRRRRRAYPEEATPKACRAAGTTSLRLTRQRERPRGGPVVPRARLQRFLPLWLVS